jgi:DNA-binding SARP family transcriptional activator
MMQLSMLDTIYARFYTLTQARLILLHPHSQYRSLFVARLLAAAPNHTFHYALRHDDIHLETFVRGILNVINARLPLFGAHLHNLDADAWNDGDLVLEAFIADLKTYGDTLLRLILDEYDCADPADEIQDFIEMLTPRLPPNVTLIINSRTLPRLPWLALIARGDALILKDDEIVVESRSNPAIQPHTRLEVRALGAGFVTLDERAIDAWEGHLPRLLFFFALDRPTITRSEICRAFWSELDTDQAVNVFHVTKRRLHKALDADILIHTDGSYRINPDLDVYYDVAEFVQQLLNGRDTTYPDRIGAYQRAIELYRGAFLLGHSDPWVIKRRAQYQHGYVEALDAVADYWLAQGRTEYALSVYQRAVLDDSARERIQRKLMRLYLTLGRRSEAAAHFQRLVDEAYRTQRDLEPETEAMRAEILLAK